MGYRERAIDLAGLAFIICCFISWKAVVAVVVALAAFLAISFMVEDREVRKRIKINEMNRLRVMVRSIEEEKK